MFKKHSCNVTKTDSYIRIAIALLLLAYATLSSSIVVALIALVILYTAFKKFCFIYYFLNINEKFSVGNYYLSFLPKYNPSAVFIFDMKGDLVFKNDAAAEKLPAVVSSQCVNVTNREELIINSQSDIIIFSKKKKYFQVELQGVKKEKFLLAYITDVTEVIELNDAIEETQREVIYAMGEIGETRSKETGNHVKRVALYSKELALLYGLSAEEAERLQMASPMHDIGKVGIADAILNAPRKLTAEEFETMKTHASLGYDMLKQSNKPILQAAAIVAHEHHEKWDGSGYPNATSGENIHIYGRITAVADVFDALGSERVYKKAWELEKILDFFKEQSGKHFDPKLVTLFLNNLAKFLVIRDNIKDIER